MKHITLWMLMLGLWLAPIFCWAAEPNTDQAKAFAEIEKVGGKLVVDEKSPDKRVLSVDVYGNVKITDAWLACLKGLTQLQTLNLGSTKVTDAGLAHLKALTQLQTLNLGATKVTDAGLAHLKGWTQLKALNLWPVPMNLQ
ncbi:MAG: leucine-rich repeat domain-containing protein [Pirellulales bacterium]